MRNSNAHGRQIRKPAVQLNEDIRLLSSSVPLRLRADTCDSCSMHAHTWLLGIEDAVVGLGRQASLLLLAPSNGWQACQPSALKYRCYCACTHHSDTGPALRALALHGGLFTLVFTPRSKSSLMMCRAQ